jgi:hypothetical protein
LACRRKTHAKAAFNASQTDRVGQAIPINLFRINGQ